MPGGLLSVVIPAYDEQERLPASVRTVCGALRRRRGAFEVLVVDDGSGDATFERVQALSRTLPEVRGIRLPRNRGKGGAVRVGMLAARGDRILMTDADLSVSIDQLDRLEAAMERGVPVVIGSRRIAGSHLVVPQPRFREFAGRVFTVIARCFLRVPVNDFTCGFKLFRADAARDIFSRARLDRWAYDVEILFLAVRRGWAVREVPVAWINSAATRVRLRRDVFSSLSELWRIRLNAETGVYRRGAIPPAR